MLQKRESVGIGSILVFLAIFLVAFGFRIQYNLNTTIDRPIRADAANYVAYAVNLLTKGIYSQELAPEPKADAQATPGYPLFLAAVFSTSKDLNTGYAAVLFYQAMLGALTASLTFLLGSLFLSPWLALLGGLLTAVSPHLITMGSYILTETLFTFLMLLSLLVFALAFRARKASILLIASIVAGLASLVRPALLLFPVFLMPLTIRAWKPNRWKQAALASILGVTLIWLPWSLWGQMHAQGGRDKPNLGLTAFVLGSYPHLYYQDPRLRGYPYLEDSLYVPMSSDWRLALATIGERAKADPLAYLSWYGFGKAKTFWSWGIVVGQGDVYVYPVSSSWYQTSAFADLTRVAMKALRPVFLLLATVGLLLLLRRMIARDECLSSEAVAAVVFGALIYYTLIHVVLAPLPRYAIPLQPLLYLAALLPVEAFLRSRFGPTIGMLRRGEDLPPEHG